MNISKKIFKNFNALFVGELFNRTARVLAIVYVARVLGVDSFGKINFALAFITYFFVATNVGLNEIGTRDVAKDPEKINLYSDSIVSIRTVLAFLAIIALSFFVYIMDKSQDTKKLILIFSLMLLPYAFSLEWVFRGVEKMTYIGISRVLSAIFYVVPIFVFIKRPDQLFDVACLTVFSEIVGAGFLYICYRKKYGVLRPNFDIKIWSGLMRLSLPLCVSSVMIITCLNSGTIILGFLKSDADVGVYSAAYKLVMVLYMINGVFITVIFPAIARLYKESVTRLESFFDRVIKLALFVAIPTGIAVTLLRAQIIKCIYGGSFGGSSAILGILIWFVVINAISYIVSYALVALDRQKAYLFIVTAAAASNLIVNFMLIPKYGAAGAAIGMCVSEALVLILSFVEIRKAISISLTKYMRDPLIAATIMGIFLFTFRQVNFILLISLGSAIYLIYMALTGALKDDIALVRSLIKR